MFAEGGFTDVAQAGVHHPGVLLDHLPIRVGHDGAVDMRHEHVCVQAGLGAMHHLHLDTRAAPVFGDGPYPVVLVRTTAIPLMEHDGDGFSIGWRHVGDGAGSKVVLHRGLGMSGEARNTKDSVNSPSSANQSGIGRSPWLAATVCGGVGFVVFQFWGNAVRGYIDTSSVFWWWGWQWFNPASESQHGPLVLGVAIWLAWRNLAKDGKRQSEQSLAPAVLAMFAGLGIHLLGYAVQQTRISIAAVMLFAWGVMRLGGGSRWGSAVMFPLGLLIFAVPVGVLDAVGFHLRLGVIATTELIAGLAGIELVRNGTQLFSPDGSYQYDVAAACSGMRSLMAMLALSAIMGYIGPRTWWRRSVVFLLAFPLTFLGNVVRISAIVFAGEWFGQGAGELVHDWAGFIVFVIVLGGVQWASNTLEESDHTGS